MTFRRKPPSNLFGSQGRPDGQAEGVSTGAVSRSGGTRARASVLSMLRSSATFSTSKASGLRLTITSTSSTGALSCNGSTSTAWPSLVFNNRSRIRRAPGLTARWSAMWLAAIGSAPDKTASSSAWLRVCWRLSMLGTVAGSACRIDSWRRSASLR